MDYIISNKPVDMSYDTMPREQEFSPLINKFILSPRPQNKLYQSQGKWNVPQSPDCMI